MDPEEKGREGGADPQTIRAISRGSNPDGAEEAKRHDVDQCRVCGVQGEIGEMVAERIKAPEK